jgi:lipopolysaccharide transport system ATP-binding protein
LKVLTRITEPTEGRATIHGRVASLLEVGTGFHPELTGRENIFLNGAILGMSRTEIVRKFDEIVAFSEVEKFIDTPVKHYSSGMYVRLAFAVAAHMEPEILLIDEVLAVGDAQFQKKCLGKMGDVAKEGRTVLFVSHNMAAVTQLCSRGVLLSEGSLKAAGTADEVVQEYLMANETRDETVDLSGYQPRHGTGEVEFEWAQLQNAKHEICRSFSIGDDIHIVFSFKAKSDHVNRRIKLAVQLRTSGDLHVCNMVDADSGFQIEHVRERELVSISMKDIRLYPDAYFVSLWAGNTTGTEDYDHVVDCLSFDIVGGGKLTTRPLPRQAGILFMTPEWEIRTDE